MKMANCICQKRKLVLALGVCKAVERTHAVTYFRVLSMGNITGWSNNLSWYFELHAAASSVSLERSKTSKKNITVVGCRRILILIFLFATLDPFVSFGRQCCQLLDLILFQFWWLSHGRLLRQSSMEHHSSRSRFPDQRKQLKV